MGRRNTKVAESLQLLVLDTNCNKVTLLSVDGICERSPFFDTDHKTVVCCRNLIMAPNHHLFEGRYFIGNFDRCYWIRFLVFIHIERRFNDRLFSRFEHAATVSPWDFHHPSPKTSASKIARLGTVRFDSRCPVSFGDLRWSVMVDSTRKNVQDTLVGACVLGDCEHCDRSKKQLVLRCGRLGVGCAESRRTARDRGYAAETRRCAFALAMVEWGRGASRPRSLGKIDRQAPICEPFHHPQLQDRYLFAYV